MKRLSLDEINSHLANLSQWALSADQNWLEFEFTFKDFKEAYGFMSQVALLAEQLNHHPNWSNVYNQVQIKLQAHDLGGISNKDIEMASFIQGLVTDSLVSKS